MSERPGSIRQNEGSRRLDHPLRRLEKHSLGSYGVRLGRLEPTAKSGWKRFELVLSGSAGDTSPPVVTGLHSAGGRGVQPWIEILDYRPSLAWGERVLDLAARGRDLALFTALVELIPPGGHLMAGCEASAHQETYRALLHGVPPAATPLGALLFRAGLPRIKFFGLPEGGWEGQQKLWAEKPIDAALARQWRKATMEELGRFLAAAPDSPHAGRAAALLKALETSDGGPVLPVS